MASLSYLEHLSKEIDRSQIEQLIKEREEWKERDSALHYKQILAKLPANIQTSFDPSPAAIKIHSPQIDPQTKTQCLDLAKQLMGWRKGPFEFLGETLDAEWRSDFKWERIHRAIGDIRNQVVLDIGCNNGYFMFKLLEKRPRLVLGFDPVLHYYTQFQFLNHFAKQENLYYELFGVEHLPLFPNSFDLILSMGIIYHHRNPMAQLLDMRNALKPGGRIILETIGIPGTESYALFPEDRYAKMKNVWFIPTLPCFINWVKRARFKNVEVIADTELNCEEQRVTRWCPPPKQSLQDFLDPKDSSRTIEGYPAARRFALVASKA